MLTLGLSITLRQFFRPKYYTTTIVRLKVSVTKGLGYSSIGKTMTPDLRFIPASCSGAITSKPKKCKFDEWITKLHSQPPKNE